MKTLTGFGYTALVIIGLIYVTCLPSTASARNVEYTNQEMDVYVTPGEPTEIQFPGKVSGGFKKKTSVVSIDKKDSDLVVFAQETLGEAGEVIIVRLEDGRSYQVRVRRAATPKDRDDVIKVEDSRPSPSSAKEDEEVAYRDKNFQYAPPSVVSGLIREMVLFAEFGKAAISGYRISDRYQGQVILDDGTMKATVDKIFTGPNLWGYVVDVENGLNQTQKLNPATFRLDGARAISAKEWELAPKPSNVEESVAGKHKTKLYIVTRAK